MGDAGGGMAAHWAALYGGGGGGGNGGAAGEGTVSSPTSGGSGGAGSPTRVVPGIEGGRVGKPARRRSRASRRAPVTLLNTDTSNFRAMVQQFTGIPAPPYTAAGGGAGPVISFGTAAGDYATGGGAMPVRPSPTPASVMSFDHLSHHRQTTSAASSLQSQLFRPQQHHHQYGADVGYGAGGAGDMFLHGFESSPEDRLLLQSIQAAQMLPRPTTTSANNTNGYNFG